MSDRAIQSAGQQPAVAPSSAAAHQQADAGLVLHVHEHAAAPVAAAGDGLHPGAADVDEGVVIAVPRPAGGRADRVHDALGEHVGQRPPEPAQQCQAEPVDPHVVVFPVASGRLQHARLTLGLSRATVRLVGQAAVAVDHVGLAEQRAFPFAGLRQHVAPGDGSVVRAVEAAVMHGGADGFVDVGDQPVIDGKPGQDGQIAFGDAEGHVDGAGVAPAGDDAATVQQHPVRAAARCGRADDLVVRRRLEVAGFQLRADVAAPFRLMGQGELCRRGDPGRVEAGLFRYDRFPPRSRGGRDVGG